MNKQQELCQKIAKTLRKEIVNAVIEEIKSDDEIEEYNLDIHSEKHITITSLLVMFRNPDDFKYCMKIHIHDYLAPADNFSLKSMLIFQNEIRKMQKMLKGE